ncbi:hypothetical protein RRG08_027799, partial [Elysia crispata]
CENTELMLVP